MPERTCQNCNVDNDAEELRRNRLRCTTCGFDMSEAGEEEDEEDTEE